MVQNCNRTASLFFYYPTREHYLKGISREINLAHTSVINQLFKLKKDKIITERVQIRASRRYPLYKANLDSKEYKKEKKLFNLKQVFNSGVIEFIEEKLMPRSIVLFGSYQKGEDIETSDIDLFIECKKEEIDLKKFEKILKRKIDLHFNVKFNLLSKELKNNIINGILLFGYLEVFK